MANILKISEATSLALHSMTYLAVNGDSKPVSTREISENFKISEAHLSKVFQRLSRQGLVVTQRGPRGGIRIAKSADQITLLHIYEAIEGPIGASECLLASRSCGFTSCVLGDIVGKVNTQVKDYLSGTKLSDLAKTLGGVTDDNKNSKKNN